MTDRVYKCRTKTSDCRRRKANNAKDFDQKNRHHRLRSFMFHYLLLCLYRDRCLAGTETFAGTSETI